MPNSNATLGGSNRVKEQNENRLEHSNEHGQVSKLIKLESIEVGSYGTNLIQHGHNHLANEQQGYNSINEPNRRTTSTTYTQPLSDSHQVTEQIENNETKAKPINRMDGIRSAPGGTGTTNRPAYYAAKASSRDSGQPESSHGPNYSHIFSPIDHHGKGVKRSSETGDQTGGASSDRSFHLDKKCEPRGLLQCGDKTMTVSAPNLCSIGAANECSTSGRCDGQFSVDGKSATRTEDDKNLDNEEEDYESSADELDYELVLSKILTEKKMVSITRSLTCFPFQLY